MNPVRLWAVFGVASCVGGGPFVSHGDCPEYIACVAAVDPDNLAGPLALVGEDGACWEDGNAVDACRQQCTSDLAVLRNQYPQELACGGDPDAALFAEGSWAFDPSDDACFLLFSGEEFTLTATVPGEFTMSMGSEPYPCTTTGRDYECALPFEVLGLDIHFDGTFDTPTTTTGTLTFGECAPTYTARFVE